MRILITDLNLRETLGVTFFFFNDTATTEIYTLSLHDALPISACEHAPEEGRAGASQELSPSERSTHRSEEHTSELQSQSNLVCRLLLEKKKNSLDCDVILPHLNFK